MFGMRAFLVCLIFLCAAAVPPAGLAAPADTYEGSGRVVQRAVETYQKLEPRLSAEQKKRFKEAYDGICESYQTAGVLLTSVTEAADAASARTALVSYQRIMTELPNMINKLDRLVQGFK